MRPAYLWMLAVALTLAGALSRADEYSDTVALFKNAGQSAAFFNNSICGAEWAMMTFDGSFPRSSGFRLLPTESTT